MRPRLVLLLVVAVAPVVAIGWQVRVFREPTASDFPPEGFEKTQVRTRAESRRVSRESDAPNEWRPASKSAKGDPRLAAMFQAVTKGRGRISRPVLEVFLHSRGRSGPSLLAAWHEGRDAAYLREAIEKYGDLPLIQMAAALEPTLKDDRMDWLARFAASDPENALPLWLAAAEHFAGGQTDDALADLKEAADRPNANSYLREMQNERRALFEAAGFEPLRAQVEALFGLNLPHISSIQAASKALNAELPARTAAGDQAAPEAIIATLNLARTLSSEDYAVTLIEQLVGLALEKRVILVIGDRDFQSFTGQTAAERLAQIERERKTINELTKTGDIIGGGASYEQATEYFRIASQEGEAAALRWFSAQRVK